MTALTLALAMDESTVAQILTWTDEPDLIRVPGEDPPAYSADQVEAARLWNSWNQVAL